MSRVMRFRSHVRLCLLIGLPIGNVAIAMAQPTMVEVLDRVRSNEALYQDVELVWETDFERFTAIEDPRELAQRDVAARVVLQGGKIFADIDTRQQSQSRRLTLTTDMISDGRRSTIVTNGNVANIVGARREPVAMVRPHTVILHMSSLSGSPLSVLLGGNLSLRSDPRTRDGDLATTDVTSRCEGLETIDGLETVRVCVEMRQTNWPKELEDGVAPLELCYLWLATERNYLPVKTVGYWHYCSASIPVSRGSVSRLAEASPGIWYPVESTYTVFDNAQAAAGKQVQQWHEVTTITKCDLNPRYDDSLFTSVTIPDGAAVYVLDADGKITNSYTQGGAGPRTSPLVRILLVVLVLALIGGGVLWLRRRARADPARAVSP